MFNHQDLSAPSSMLFTGGFGDRAAGVVYAAPRQPAGRGGIEGVGPWGGERSRRERPRTFLDRNGLAGRHRDLWGRANDYGHPRAVGGDDGRAAFVSLANELEQEVEELFAEQQPKQTYLVEKIKREMRKTEKQIADLTDLLTEMKHQRPLLERIDALEDRRLGLELQMSDAVEIARPQVLNMKEDELQEFAEHWRTDLTAGTVEKRKSTFRQIIDSATFDGNELQVIPSYQAITGVKMAGGVP